MDLEIQIIEELKGWTRYRFLPLEGKDVLDVPISEVVTPLIKAMRLITIHRLRIERDDQPQIMLDFIPSYRFVTITTACERANIRFIRDLVCIPTMSVIPVTYLEKLMPIPLAQELFAFVALIVAQLDVMEVDHKNEQRVTTFMEQQEAQLELLHMLEDGETLITKARFQEDVERGELDIKTQLLPREDYKSEFRLTSWLHAAARGANPAVIQMLLEQGLDVNGRDCNQGTPLYQLIFFRCTYTTVTRNQMKACRDDLKAQERENLEKVDRIIESFRLLVEAGANLEAFDSMGNTLLGKAAKEHNILMMELLMAQGASLWTEHLPPPSSLRGDVVIPALSSIWRRKVDVGRRIAAEAALLARKYPEDVKVICTAMKKAQLRVFPADDYKIRASFIYFCAKAEMEKMLTNETLDERQDHNSAALFVTRRATRLAACFSQANGLLSEIDSKLNFHPQVAYGDSPLAVICSEEHASHEMAELIVNHGTPCPVTGCTPLMYVVRSGSNLYQKMIQNHNCDLDAKDIFGTTLDNMLANKKDYFQDVVDRVRLVEQNDEKKVVGAQEGPDVRQIAEDMHQYQFEEHMVVAPDGKYNHHDDIRRELRELHVMEWIGIQNDRMRHLLLQRMPGVGEGRHERALHYIGKVQRALKKQRQERYEAALRRKTLAGQRILNFWSFQAESPEHSAMYLRQLMEDEPDVDEAKSDSGRTALQNAAIHGNPLAMRQLIDAKADITRFAEHKTSVLHDAARYGYPECIEVCLEQGLLVDTLDGDGNTPLYKAASGGHIASMRVLLQHGADMWVENSLRRTPVMHALYYEDVKVGMNSPSDCTAEILQLLVTQPVHPVTKQTVLMVAAHCGYERKVQVLLDLGVDPDVCDASGKTALMIASARKKKECVRLLRGNLTDEELAPWLGEMYVVPSSSNEPVSQNSELDEYDEDDEDGEYWE